MLSNLKISLSLILFLSSCITSFSQAAQEMSQERSLALSIVASKAEEIRSLLASATPTADQSVLAREIFDELLRQGGKLKPMEIERVARVGLSIAESVNNKREVARGWLVIGNSQVEPKAKLDSYKTALAAANDAKADELAVNIIISIGRMEESWDKQIEWYEKAIVYAERYPDKKVLSNLIGRIAIANTIKGDYTTAMSYHARAMEIRTALNDVVGIAATISNIGIIYESQGDSTAAIENFKKSLGMLESHPETNSPDMIQRKAKDLRNLGIAYYAIGDYAQASEYYSKSLKMSEDGKYADGVFGALFQIATLYNAQGEFELARRALRQAEGVSIDDELSDYVNGPLGESYLGEKRYDKALNIFLKQLAAAEKSGNKHDQAEKFIDIGEVYLLTNDAEKAESYFERGIKQWSEIGRDTKVFVALLGVAKSRLLRKDFVGTLEYTGSAQEQFKKLRGHPESWDLYSTIGAAYSGMGKHDLARINFQRAIKIVEDQRAKFIRGSSEEQAVLSQSITPFHSMVELNAEEDSAESAFSFAEQAKARTLLDLLIDGKVRISGKMSAVDVKQEQVLKNDLASLNAQILTEARSSRQIPGKLAELETRLNHKRFEYSSFLTGIYSKDPELKTQRGEMRPASVAEVGVLLSGTKSAFVEFVVANDKTFAFVISKNTAGRPAIKLYPIEIKQQELRSRVDDYRSKLAAGDLNFQEKSRQLYELLLKPGAAHLAGKTNIAIVSDGPLWDLPFQALMDENGEYLVEKMAVSYAPSLTALREMKKKAKQRVSAADAELIAFGNPIVGKETKERVKRVFMNETMEPLPEAERLVNELGKMYGPKRSKIFVGSEAREETAKKESPNYRIVQFATHGILNNVSPMYSHLVFAQNEKNPNEDGLLEAWELKDLDLKADMVILTACETARGKIANGEGMIGMTWASFIAGAPTTVASQWKVESSSTTELMLEFHRQLLSKKKVSKAEALRRASLKVMKMPKYRHPSYWAGFVIVGDAS